MVLTVKTASESVFTKVQSWRYGDICLTFAGRFKLYFHSRLSECAIYGDSGGRRSGHAD